MKPIQKMQGSNIRCFSVLKDQKFEISTSKNSYVIKPLLKMQGSAIWFYPYQKYLDRLFLRKNIPLQLYLCFKNFQFRKFYFI